MIKKFDLFEKYGSNTEVERLTSYFTMLLKYNFDQHPWDELDQRMYMTDHGVELMTLYGKKIEYKVEDLENLKRFGLDNSELLV